LTEPSEKNSSSLLPGRLRRILQGAFASSLFVALTLLILIQLLSKLTNGYAEGLASELLAPVTAVADQRAKDTPEAPGTAAEQQRIFQQLEEIRARARHHREMVVYFYSRYYMAILVAALTGAAAAVLMLAAGQEGWRKAKGPVLTSILVLAAAAAFYGSFPALFQQEENATANATLLKAYENLEGKILTYLATERLPDKEGRVSPSDLILLIDDRLEELREIRIGFDPNAIPDYSDRLGKLTSGSG
jgi:hypothetical protein